MPTPTPGPAPTPAPVPLPVLPACVPLPNTTLSAVATSLPAAGTPGSTKAAEDAYRVLLAMSRVYARFLEERMWLWNCKGQPVDHPPVPPQLLQWADWVESQPSLKNPFDWRLPCLTPNNTVAGTDCKSGRGPFGEPALTPVAATPAGNASGTTLPPPPPAAASASPTPPSPNAPAIAPKPITTGGPRPGANPTTSPSDEILKRNARAEVKRSLESLSGTEINGLHGDT